MDGNNKDFVLINCLDWQRKSLISAIGVSSSVEQHPHLCDRQRQITWHMQAALAGIEELRNEVQAHPLRSPDER